VDGVACRDVYDFWFRASDGNVTLTVEDNGVLTTLNYDGSQDRPGAIEFADMLADGTRSCNNRCVFCFVRQLPRGMRRSLYVRDDDYRLSFGYGNYITLTNLTDEDLTRLREQRLSPLYVSVHATDPAIRGMLLGRKSDAPVLEQLDWHASVGIDTHVQIVVCPGLNDGEVLDETISALAGLHPAATGRRHGVLSAATVPVGLTRHRRGLADLRAPNTTDAIALIGWLRKETQRWRVALGTRFVWLSDEWYLLAERPIPNRRHYEGFPQLADGVGTTRLFLDRLAYLKRRLPTAAPSPRHGLLVTGELAGSVVTQLSTALNAVARVETHVVIVKNEYFGGTISAAGLLTGADIIRAIRGVTLPGTVYIPDVCMRYGGDRLLDDMTLDDLAKATGREVRCVPADPVDLARDMGLT
jgi:putative radical SAM enzyme (TIGR03279 family)